MKKKLIAVVIGLMFLFIIRKIDTEAYEDNEAPWIQSVEAEDGQELLNGNGGLGKEYTDSLGINIYVSDAGGSGPSHISYYLVNNGVAGGESRVNLDDSLSCKIVINGDFTGALYLKAIDNEGNQSDYICVPNITVQTKKNEAENQPEENAEPDIEDNVENNIEENLQENEMQEESVIIEENDTDSENMVPDNLNDFKEENADLNDTVPVTDNHPVMENKETDEYVPDDKPNEFEFDLLSKNEAIRKIIMDKVRLHEGSYFYPDNEYEKILNQYNNSLPDIVIYEENEDKIIEDTVSLNIYVNGNKKELINNQDFIIRSIDQVRTHKYRYEIKSHVFMEDGMYSVSINNIDSYGNNNFNKDKFYFGIDRNAPYIEAINLDNNQVFRTQIIKADICIKDNIELDKVKIYLNNEETDFTQNEDIFYFNVYESGRKQEIKVVATDKAGNESQQIYAGLLVSSNALTVLLNNKKLLFGLFLIITGALSFLILSILKRKNKSYEKEY